MDILTGGGGTTRVGSFSSSLLWCESDGSAEPTFTAHVLLGGAYVSSFVVLAGPDAMHVLVAEAGAVPLRWYRWAPGSVPPLVHVLDGPFASRDLASLAVAVSPANTNHDPAALDVVVGSGRGVTWYFSDGRSPPSYTESLAIQGFVFDVGVADIDGKPETQRQRVTSACWLGNYVQQIEIIETD